MTHKAGGDANDAELAAWWSALKPHRDKVLLGAYWVLYPGNPTGRADAFLARLDSQCPGWRDGPFILQLDCEIWNGNPDTQPDLLEIKTACNRLAAKMPKLRPIVYASAGQYSSTLRGLDYPLWNARYPVSAVSTASDLYARASGDTGSGWNAFSGQVPAVWQFSSSATALRQTTCDVNAFRGTLDELTALVAPGWSDDVSQADVTAALEAFFPRGYQDVAKTQRTSRIGEDALNQYVPNPIRGQKTTAWALLQDIATKVAVAAEDDVDEAAIAAAVLAGLSADVIAAKVVAAMPSDQARQTAQAIIDLVAEQASPSTQ